MRGLRLASLPQATRFRVPDCFDEPVRVTSNTNSAIVEQQEDLAPTAQVPLTPLRIVTNPTTIAYPPGFEYTPDNPPQEQRVNQPAQLDGDDIFGFDTPEYAPYSPIVMMINSIDDDHSCSLSDKANADYPLDVCHSLLHHCLVELNVARSNNNLSQINHYTVLHEDLSFIHSILSRYSVLPTSSCRTDSISVLSPSFITHHPGQTRTRFDYISVQICDNLLMKLSK
jgi:hypothetical protein